MNYLENPSSRVISCLLSADYLLMSHRNDYMKPFSAKIRKDVHDPLQLDFLSNIPEPPTPMKPIEPSPDGTPPLPLMTPSTEPVADVFDSDPFFNSDEIPFEIDSPAPPVPERTPAATAEERLLETIVHKSGDNEETSTPFINAEELALLRSELDSAVEKADKAGAAHDKTQKDLQILKTRFAALESELAAAREGLIKADQARCQTELRFAEAEQQWMDKLSHLRHMLDEVEDTRDEVFQKRVPRLLFIGTLIAGIIATIFAYLIGLGQSPSTPAITGIQDKTQATASALPLSLIHISEPTRPY